MTHFTVAVILPEGEEINPVNELDIDYWVTELMAPYDENGTWFRDGSRWDWWVIGGRWDGAIRGLEWKPKMEECDLCSGTGVRPDGREQFGDEWFEQMNGCNGCRGRGEREAWTTDPHYRDLERNVCQVKEVSLEYTPTAFVRPTGEWVESARVGWFGMSMPDEDGVEPGQKVAPFDQAWAEVRDKYADHLVVGIDCHV